MAHDTTAGSARFTWVRCFGELAEKLVAYRHRQQELIDLLEGLRKKGHTITPLGDKDAAGNPFPMKELDPFTFFGVFNRGLTTDKRILIVEELVAHFGLTSPAPKDFEGIPILNNQNSWFISFAAKRGPTDVERLWEVFVRALGEDPLNEPAFGAAFDAALEVRGTNVNLTTGLFWIRPNTFLSLDGTLREHLGLKLPGSGLTFAFYRDVVQKVRKQHGADFMKLSRAAYVSGEEEIGSTTLPSKPPPKDIDAILDGDTQFWLVGAYWDDRAPADQTERFLAEGLWENGYSDRYLDLVKRMKPGDRIAIKASATQLNGLPFENHGKTVSKIVVKARGTVVRNHGDGRSVEVEWEPKAPARNWYFYTGRGTVWQLRKDEEMSRMLARFVFFDVPQDFAWFTKQWWGSGVDVDAGGTGEDGPTLTEPYGVEDVLAEGVFLGTAEVELALRRLRMKRLLVLQGAPGVGKTFVAKKLAYALMGERDDERVETLQFHPSFTYEDFVRGYRPTGEAGKFELRDGPFLRLCERARLDDRPHVLVIDEINRGHVSQVFGELFMLLEADKRGPAHAVTPLYRRHEDEKFHVPENVFVISTMNIADRSLALVDFALRRRFAFITLEPRFADPAFRKWLTDRKLQDSVLQLVVKRLSALNEQIAADAQLGPAFRVGHSFFCPRGEDFSSLGPDWFREVVDTEIAPLLEEYWYDAPEKARTAKEALLT